MKLPIYLLLIPLRVPVGLWGPRMKFANLGGTLFWAAPGDITQVTHYVAYLAEDAIGTNRSYFGKLCKSCKVEGGHIQIRVISIIM